MEPLGYKDRIDKKTTYTWARLKRQSKDITSLLWIKFNPCTVIEAHLISKQHYPKWSILWLTNKKPQFIEENNVEI